MRTKETLSIVFLTLPGDMANQTSKENTKKDLDSKWAEKVKKIRIIDI